MDNKDFLEGTFDPYIGHEIVEIKENYVKSSLEVKDYHKQPMGMVHGGVIDTMAEAAISYAAYFTQEGTWVGVNNCLLYTSPSPRDNRTSRMPSSA